MEFLDNINAEALLGIGLPIALAIIMFSLGLGLKFADFTRIARRPLAFFTGAVNQLITLPLIALLIVILFNLPPALAVGFMIVALCPGGVTTNILTKMADGDVALSVSLTAVISLLSIVTLPILVSFFVGLFISDEIVVDATEISLKMVTVVAVPVLIGMLVRLILRRFAEPVERFFSLIAKVLFVIVMLAALYAFWDSFIAKLSLLGPAIIALLLAALFAGWASAKFLGMSKREVTSISIETGVQNGTVGITLASFLAAGNTGLSDFALPSAVYGVLMYVVVIPFVFWRTMGRKE